MVRQLRPPTYLNRFFSEDTEHIKITFWVTRVVGLCTESKLFESRLWQQMKRLSVDSAQIVYQIRIKMVKRCTKIEFSSIFYKALPKLIIIAPVHKSYLNDLISGYASFFWGNESWYECLRPEMLPFPPKYPLLLNYWRELKFGIVSGNIWYSSHLKSQEMTLI